MSTGAWPTIHATARSCQNEGLCRCSAVQVASLQAQPVRCCKEYSECVESCHSSLDKDSAVSMCSILRVIQDSVVCSIANVMDD